jgi:eukaryotic-like serine/threonine-protein kinase
MPPDPLDRPESARHASPVSTIVDTSYPNLDDVALFGAEGFEARYAPLGVIGGGGMGEVRLYKDLRVGRDVAMKVIRPERASRPDNARRFVREARVQGQLEHPAIVPVYDLGRGPDGAAYFTMKRVHGETLAGAVDALASGQPQARTRFTRHKLLTAFGRACLAVHFAHTRGVLHRDLKPDNVMLGEFGEVYVLDWGLAKVIPSPELSGTRDSEGRIIVTPQPEEGSAAAKTAMGAVLGTPGYMAPEQLSGDIDALDARTDVYALGSILFEILALRPLHEGKSSAEIRRSTLVGADARPGVRAPDQDVPPELDAVCVRATAGDPAKRYESARDLYEAVESFLNGDRDVERRRELAGLHARAAADVSTRALESGESGVQARRRAMRELGRALALDPANADAMRTLVRLLETVPAELPGEVGQQLQGVRAQLQRAAARAGSVGYMTVVLLAPLLYWMGIRSVAGCTALVALFLAASVACVVRARLPGVAPVHANVILGLSTAGIALLAGVTGPLLVVPSFAAVNAIAFATSRGRSERLRVFMICSGAVFVPLLLEALGVLPPAYAFRNGMMLVLPRLADLPSVPTTAFLVTITFALLLAAAVFVTYVTDSLTAAEKRLAYHSWQLRQLVPEGPSKADQPG